MPKSDLPTIRGPIKVQFDCRPGDVISVEGKNARVSDTWPNYVKLAFSDGVTSMFSYAHLHELEASYVALLIPVLPG